MYELKFESFYHSMIVPSIFCSSDTHIASDHLGLVFFYMLGRLLYIPLPGIGVNSRIFIEGFSLNIVHFVYLV